MKKKLTCLLLCLVLALSLLPLSAGASNVISKIDIVLRNPPKVGEKAEWPDYDDPEGLKFAGFRWDDSYEVDQYGKVFQPGEVYAFQITLKLLEGYSFVGGSGKKVSATINGIAAKIYVDEKWYPGEITLKVTFPALPGEAAVIEDTVISHIEITDMPEPKIGDTIKASQPYTIVTEGLRGYCAGWTDDTGKGILALEGGSFEAGRTYTKSLGLKTEPHYVFATKENGDPDVTVTINGKAAVVERIQELSNKRYVIYFNYTFPRLKQSVIAAVSARVTPPSAGGTLQDTKVEITTANADWLQFSWDPVPPFEAGKTYRVTVRATRLSPEYIFTDHTAVLINGRTAAIQAVSDDEISFSLDFTLDLPTVSRIEAKITAPVAGEKADFSPETDADSYTLSDVRWWELDSEREWVANLAEGDVFKPNTWYYLWIDATPGEGFAFASSASGYINGEKGGVTKKSVGSPIYQVYTTFKTGELKTLASIAVTTPPDKTEYTAGESFDGTGMAVTATYSDGSTAEVTGWTAEPTGMMENVTEVTVTYTEGEITVTTAQAVTVKPALSYPISLDIAADPDKLVYTEGEPFDPTGAVLLVTYSNGKIAEVQDFLYTPLGSLSPKDTVVTFTYTENDVTVTAKMNVWVEVKAEEKPEEQPQEKANPFKDVFETDYFYDAVLWAYYAEPQVTNGISADEFAPGSTVTRGQAVTFLWRAMGRPEPLSAENPFGDVKESDYFYKAVLWAVEKGITKGTDETRFSPGQTCSTAHILTFLYRALGIGPDGWYAAAEAWAGDNGLLKDLNLAVAPGVDCPRGEVALFLWRALVK